MNLIQKEISPGTNPGLKAICLRSVDIMLKYVYRSIEKFGFL